MSALISDSDRVLLVKRKRPPYAGCWALPGGKIHPYETQHEALVREVREETGLAVAPKRLAGVAEAIDRQAEHHYVVVVWAAAVTGGAARAGDDAEELAWLSREEASKRPLTPNLERYLLEFGAFA